MLRRRWPVAWAFNWFAFCLARPGALSTSAIRVEHCLVYEGIKRAGGAKNMNIDKKDDQEKSPGLEPVSRIPRRPKEGKCSSR
ncbi:hypothetical protein J6590_097453 [Homalodisca vitripennis]|nr:hypothetical protein J6590_097453 [Homalodisca vitripennis]